MIQVPADNRTYFCRLIQTKSKVQMAQQFVAVEEGTVEMILCCALESFPSNHVFPHAKVVVESRAWGLFRFSIAPTYLFKRHKYRMPASTFGMKLSTDSCDNNMHPIIFIVTHALP